MYRENYPKARFHIQFGPPSLFERVRFKMRDAHKLYLADKKDDIYTAGLWAVRLMFTTESPRECVEVVRGQLGLSDYRPNVLTRGLYYRGVE